MSKKILLVGCGQLGSRHLQAAASLKEIDELYVLDPSEKSLELGKKRVGEISDLNPEIKFEWLTDFDARAAGGELCVVATQSKGRCALIKRIAGELGYKKFLIEKIVSQSVAEYRDLMDFAQENGLSIWVNCKTRAYSVHQHIKSQLDPNEPIVFSDFGGNHGLGNNGVHSADLFVFYDGTAKIIPAGSRIVPALLPSKRGSDIFDLGGTLYGVSKKGSDFILSFSNRHNSPDHISIVSKGCRFVVDHFQKFAYESYERDGWQWKKIEINENWSVSFMSKAFIADILNAGKCDLPTLPQCYPAHEFILEQLLPHFNRLLEVNNDFCPVT